MNGVSLIICCHNSADKLPHTVNHVNELKVSSDIPWELIIVDNASTDGTSDIAAQLLSDEIKNLSKIVTENAVGLRNARLRGIAEARYEYISFIDDDNWICPDWINVVYDIMSEHPEVGVCGGVGYPSFESTPPAWFEQYQGCYAVGPQGETTGYVDSRMFLWGAGMTIRRAAWEEIISNGFSFTLSGRHGANLSAGEDSEICLALRCYSWRLWYDERLSYYHYLPSFRLTLDYLKKLHRGFGASEIVLGAYREFINSDVSQTREFRNIWMKDSASIIRYYKNRIFRLCLSQCAGEQSSELSDTIGFHGQLGKLWAIIKLRKKYDEMQKEIYLFWQNSKLYKEKIDEANRPKNTKSPGIDTADSRMLLERDEIISNLQHRIDELESSLSWRLTAPLRKLLDAFRKG